MSNWYITPSNSDLMHYGIKGMKWRNKKGPQVKAIPYYKKKNAADLGAEVGTDFKTQKIIKGQTNKNNQKDPETAKQILPINKRAKLERVWKQYAKALINAKTHEQKKAIDNKFEAYYKRLSKNEQTYINMLSKKAKQTGIKVFNH